MVDEARDLMGVSYQCDFRAEEEMGSGKITQIMTGAMAKRDHFRKELVKQKKWEAKQKKWEQGKVSQAPGTQSQYVSIIDTEDQRQWFVMSSHFSESQFAEAVESLTSSSRSLFLPSKSRLLDEAKELGVSMRTTMTKEQLAQAIDQIKRTKEGQGEYRQRAWFHMGDMLVTEYLPGTTLGEVLRLLVAAADEGHLLVGDGGLSPFGSGLTMIDSRDVSDEERKQVTEKNQWYRDQMDVLSESKVLDAVIKRMGGRPFFLGSPKLQKNGTVSYWLNGRTMKMDSGKMEQPFGWFTIEELFAEEYAKERD